MWSLAPAENLCYRFQVKCCWVLHISSLIYLHIFPVLFLTFFYLSFALVYPISNLHTFCRQSASVLSHLWQEYSIIDKFWGSQDGTLLCRSKYSCSVFAIAFLLYLSLHAVNSDIFRCLSFHYVYYVDHINFQDAHVDVPTEDPSSFIIVNEMSRLLLMRFVTLQ
jgi:hypothetical protein